MRILGKFLMVALCVTALSFGAVIDSFGVVQQANDSTTGGVPATSTIGNRTIIANKLVGGANLWLDAVSNGSEFFVSTNTTVSGTGGASYTGLWNLTSPVAGLAIDLIFKDLSGGDIAFWVSDGTGLMTSPMIALPAGPNAMVVALFSAFTGTAVNYGAITSLGFTAYTALNQDLQFDNFQTYVPEPATYAMMAAGLLGLFAIRRKKA